MTPEVLQKVYDYAVGQAKGRAGVNLVKGYKLIAAELGISDRTLKRALDHLTEQGVFRYRDNLYVTFAQEHADRMKIALHGEESADLQKQTRDRADGLMTQGQWDELFRNIAAHCQEMPERAVQAMIQKHRSYRNRNGGQAIY